ncbi:uncharacterized protein LOC142821532 isoform X2 [Pelodiscus sinensis]|uniref:uncharacterized protein LOC142821532 isoform X2 n=1 Tax=Pelodiscus sinensis TaxID=13735 RepID=UPI003F6ACFCA
MQGAGPAPRVTTRGVPHVPRSRSGGAAASSARRGLSPGETIPHRHLRPNYQLGNLVELVKRLQLPAGPVPEGQPECERHQEALKLFCQEDQAPICVVCDRSRAHRAHTVVPIEEAAQECKEQILSCLQRLREERDALRGLESDWAEESERLLRQTDVERQLVGWECERLRKFLAERERLLLARLGELDKEIGRRREEHAARLGEDISRLSTLISELEEKCRQPALELLQGVRSAVSRGEEATSPHPAPKCPELERRIRDFPGENSLQGAVTGFLGALAAERGEDPGCCPRTGHSSCWEPVPPPRATPGLGGRARIGAVRGAQDSGEPEDSQVPRHKAGCWSEVTDTVPQSHVLAAAVSVPPFPLLIHPQWPDPGTFCCPPPLPPNDLVLSLEVPPALGDGSSEWGTLRLRQAGLPPPHILSPAGLSPGSSVTAAPAVTDPSQRLSLAWAALSLHGREGQANRACGANKPLGHPPSVHQHPATPSSPAQGDWGWSVLNVSPERCQAPAFLLLSQLMQQEHKGRGWEPPGPEVSEGTKLVYSKKPMSGPVAAEKPPTNLFVSPAFLKLWVPRPWGVTSNLGGGVAVSQV